MRLRHIEVVNAIRVTGTLKAAAALLSLTQPAITQTLQSAERQLGYPLFERVRGKLIPTREAQTLFPEIMRLDEQLQAVQRLAENLRGGTDGSSIRILAAPAMAQTVVVDAALAFKALHPGVKLSIRADYSATAVANIALMEADIGVLYHSVSHPAIKEIELASSRLVCVGHPDILDSAPFMEISALEGREIIGPDPADPLGRLLAKRLEELSVTVRSSVTAQSYHSLVALAARSKVVTIVDEIAALSARAQGLNVVPLAPEIAIPVVASVAINGERSALVEQFMQVCRNTFRTLG
ncbi:LysR family transcriptional regulator [Paraburkholderia aspalathi]|uniref:DNA-binding transcriptional regulator, LysR family n=1 Tax=Paraburkholderia aspalathi TaxID=1324617 RepID=A0A1I6ZKH0_9BURK|nr:LysR substrate-binding domain-containing protein [Paraburkholderia aspalathi]SFT63127.1 DNA-binding transcriptional regulator, LysR family [Paraburkholderia aspalathi]